MSPTVVQKIELVSERLLANLKTKKELDTKSIFDNYN